MAGLAQAGQVRVKFCSQCIAIKSNAHPTDVAGVVDTAPAAAPSVPSSWWLLGGDSFWKGPFDTRLAPLPSELEALPPVPAAREKEGKRKKLICIRSSSRIAI